MRIGSALKQIFCVVIILNTSCVKQHDKSNLGIKTVVTSPDGKNELRFLLTSEGSPAYVLSRQGEILIDTSLLGLELYQNNDLKSGFKLTGISLDMVDEKWALPWGESDSVTDHHNEMTVHLKESAKPNRRMDLVFRIYDDGLGFRYVFPRQNDLEQIQIEEELTEFQFTSDPLCWWIPGDWDSYEHLYGTDRLSVINAISRRNHPSLIQSYIPYNAVGTPVTMRDDRGIYLSIHEAALTDYAGMTLLVDTAGLKMRSLLVGSDRNPWKVETTLPFRSPWRTVQIAERAGDLLESNLILNLNEPDQLGGVPWFKPQKYTGIWWEMHLGISDWAYSGAHHGATTAHTKELIDFAAQHHIGAVLVEGWNEGWEHWIGPDRKDDNFDFVTPYPDYDPIEISRYAKKNDVAMIMHHETSALPLQYELQMDTGFKFMRSLDMHLVKTGYVGPIRPEGEHHHGQWMVAHYRRVLEKASEYQIAVDVHEPIKPTGIRRTYPNAISREGLRGQEFNAWSADGGNPPEHLTIVAFTRLLAGPIDYTPGIFQLDLSQYKPGKHINTTLAHQLALYVVLYSPVQMVPDLIENYRNQPAFTFIEQVGVDWSQSLVPAGEPGDFIVVARKQRESHNWFVGAITDENARQISLPMSFLDKGAAYRVSIYVDGKDADYKDNPTSLEIKSIAGISSTDTLQFQLAPGGGAAVSIYKLED